MAVWFLIPIILPSHVTPISSATIAALHNPRIDNLPCPFKNIFVSLVTMTKQARAQKSLIQGVTERCDKFVQDLYTPKRQKISISTCVWKHLIWLTAERILCKHRQQIVSVSADRVGPYLLTGKHYRDSLLAWSAKATGRRITGSHITKVAHAWWSSTRFWPCCARYYDGPTTWPPRSPDFNPLDVTCKDT
jgi:hypothetical protein